MPRNSHPLGLLPTQHKPEDGHSIPHNSCPAVQVENSRKVQTYSPEELSSFVMVKMKDTAEQYLNKKKSS
jgi:molecular chaperone DnaK (HSP70)